MSVPTPAVVERAIDMLRASAQKVAFDYGQLHSSAWHRPRRGGGTGASTTHEDGTPRNLSDDLGGEIGQVRRCVESAGRKVLEALAVIRAAEAYLSDAVAVIERHTPLAPEVADDRLIPREADRGDLERARAAQRRRIERSRRVPWGRDEVSG